MSGLLEKISYKIIPEDEQIEVLSEQEKSLLESFGLGFIAGSLASLTTTICNIFTSYIEQYRKWTKKYPRTIGTGAIGGVRVSLGRANTALHLEALLEAL